MGDALPVVSAPSGQRFAGWTFECIEGTYTALIGSLLTFLAEKEGSITATASFVDASSDGSGSSDAEGSIIGGTSAGTLNPEGTANRAQFAAILWRFCQTTAV